MERMFVGHSLAGEGAQGKEKALVPSSRGGRVTPWSLGPRIRGCRYNIRGLGGTVTGGSEISAWVSQD